MKHFSRQPKFTIQPTIDQKPFENLAVRAFFSRWCKVNDSITPKFITRGGWEELGEEGVLRKNKNGKHTLFIPKDLQLWEMVGIMERVDHNTFPSRPEIATDKVEQIYALGKTFRNTGVYITKRLESISEGRDIAEALAQEFYEYGEALVSGVRGGEEPRQKDISTLSLTPEETEEVDRWLAGDSLYASRYMRVLKTGGGSKEIQTSLEVEREHTLAQFFRVAQKAFELKKKSEDDTLGQGNRSHVKPWESNTPIHSTFLAKIERQMKQEIETPKRELTGVMFRRGLEFLIFW